MSTKALIGILLAGTVGILVFLFVHLSGGSNKITVGAKQAKACARSANGQDDCLPDVKYIDTTGHAYTADSLAGKVVVGARIRVPFSDKSLLATVVEMGDLTAIDTPLLDAVLGLVRQRARLAGCYP